MEAEKEKYKNEQHHQESTIAYLELERRASQLEKQLRKSVNKAKLVRYLSVCLLLVSLEKGREGLHFHSLTTLFTMMVNILKLST